MQFPSILVFLIALICGNALAGDAERFARELNWEAKWQRVIDRSTKKYIARIEKRQLSDIPSAERKEATTELRRYFDSQLSWKATGRDFTSNMINSCDTDVLDTLVRIKKKQYVPSEKKKQVMTAYRRCAKKGYKESMHSLRDRIPTLMKDVRAIIAKYN